MLRSLKCWRLRSGIGLYRQFTTDKNANKPKIGIVYYSMFGHIATMAKEVQKGVEEAGGEPLLFQARETLPESVLQAMHAPPKDTSVPYLEFSNIDTLTKVDGVLFGIPTRFGLMPAQLKGCDTVFVTVFDATGGLWVKGALVGKPAGVFVSTGTPGGGQESTVITTLTQLAHHGMVFVPIGYSTPLLQDMTEVRGGSSWGAGTFAGTDNKRQPSEIEKKIAHHQGKHFTKIVAAFKRGMGS